MKLARLFYQINLFSILFPAYFNNPLILLLVLIRPNQSQNINQVNGFIHECFHRRNKQFYCVYEYNPKLNIGSRDPKVYETRERPHVTSYLSSLKMYHNNVAP